MDKHEAISELERIVNNNLPGAFAAQYYLSNLANTTGDDYDALVPVMIEWVMKLRGISPETQDPKASD